MVRLVPRGGGRATAVRMGRQAMRSMRVRRGPVRPKGQFAKKVLAVVSRQEETKYVANAYDATGAVLPNLWYSQGNITAVGDYNPALPKLTQGEDDFQRIGNKIRPTSVAVSLKIGINALDLSANSLIGVIYYGTSRTEKTWQNNNPIQTVAILDNGDGTNSSFNGVRYDLTKPLDKKLVTARRITFRLSKTGGIQNSDNGVATTQPGNFSTSNGLSEKSFMLRFRAPKSLSYQQAASTYPTNYAPWYAIGFCHADGSPLTAHDQQNLVNINSKCHMYFKDA